MKREEVIEQLALKRLSQLSEKERAEQLDIMGGWDSCEEWSLLPQDIIDEFESGELKDPPDSQKYDQVLMIWLRDDLKAVTNNYLSAQSGIASVEGKPIQLFSCPCCGSRTIERQGHYEICTVCWWEDDGSDNHSADKISGPNRISLTQSRYNFLKFGIYDSKRKDLIAKKEPKSKYESERTFEIDGDFIFERETAWRAKYIPAEI